MADIRLDFVGPFSFHDAANSVFHSPYATSSGLYLWTVRQSSDNTHLIHYVGETASFGKRQKEHLLQILGLNYGIFDAEKAKRGISELVWKGLWRDKTVGGPLKLIAAYKALHEDVIPYLAIIQVFFAELNVDSNLRKHIEGCIGWNLRTKHPEDKKLYPDDNHIGVQKEKNNGELHITASEIIRGLDSRIPY